mmetsp:Transcript_93992/g.201711  ORF Transcript_93992/g.201711 Transcript_93992/m.201711 type:complete len:362 (+) Transcript_93992:79-1164(+)
MPAARCNTVLCVAILHGCVGLVIATGTGHAQEVRRSRAALVRHEERAATLQDTAATCKIFTLWDWPNGAPQYAVLNLLSWSRHTSPHCRGVLINDTNVKEWIPDLPDEYFRLPYPAAKADMIRYALIYHHGGIYLDSDFLVAKDIRPLISSLHSHDLVTYAASGQNCKDSFSSNFEGGRQGSRYHKAVWNEQKQALLSHCAESDAEKEVICCFDNPALRCHIPWTQLGERISHRVLKAMHPALEMQCLKECDCPTPEGFVPRDMEAVLTEHPVLDDALSFWAAKGVKNPMDRAAYHLFNSITGLSQLSHSQIFNATTVIGALYTQSLGSEAVLASERGSEAPRRLVAVVESSGAIARAQEP